MDWNEDLTSECGITLHSQAKINLSLDVGKPRGDGMHPVDMILQQIAFHDDVSVAFLPRTSGGTGGPRRIILTSNRKYLPTDERNLAYRAALLMDRKYGSRIPAGDIRIDILKRIPIAAGLAGGSGNGTAVLHALNVLWGLRLPLAAIMKLSEELGSDCPFCAASQAKTDRELPDEIRSAPEAGCCMRATGTGTDLTPVAPLRSPLVIAKPRFGVSTAEVYRGIDRLEIRRRPDNDRLARALDRNDRTMTKDFINVLEEYTLRNYPQVQDLKHLLTDHGADIALMSGSGPTVFGLFRSMNTAMEASEAARKFGAEAYWTKTCW